MILTTEIEAKEWFAEKSPLGEYDMSIMFIREIEPNLGFMPLCVINRIERLFQAVIDKSPYRNPLKSLCEIMRSEIKSRRGEDVCRYEDVKDKEIIALIKTGMKSENISEKLRCSLNNVVCLKRELQSKKNKKETME